MILCMYLLNKQTNKQTKTDYSSISFFVLERLLMIMRGFMLLIRKSQLSIIMGVTSHDIFSV